MANPRRLPPLNALRALEAAARHGNVARAAEELGVTPGAVSQQIRQLEQLVGVALFRRHARGVALTEAAAPALPLLTDAFDRLREASEALAGGDDHAIVRVGAPRAFGVKWLMPRLAAFADAVEGAAAVLTCDPDPTALDRFHLDVEIRFGPAPQGAVQSRRLLAETVAPACSPALLSGQGAARARAALEGAPLIHDASPDPDPACPDWTEWLRQHGVARADAGRGDRYASSEHVVDAAASGRGIGLVKRTLAQQDIALGRVEMVFVGDLTTLSGAYHLVWPKGRALSPAARAFAAWVEAEAAPFEHAGV